MRIVSNDIIPFKGFRAINLFEVVFIRRETVVDITLLNHVAIHTEQMRELLYVPFYLWYLIEWLIGLAQYGNAKDAYRNISFEKEAFLNDWNDEYLDNRESFNFLKYM